MTRVKTLGVAIIAILVVGATMAGAAAAVTPALLILSGKVTELRMEGKGGGCDLEQANGKTLAGTGATFTASEFTEAGSPLDTKAGVATIDCSGVKEGKVACRSETASGAKDPIETVLSKLDLQVASEKTAGGVLEPLLISTVLGQAGSEELIVNCGGVKDKVKGHIGCLLLPGETNIPANEPKAAELLCKSEPKGKQVTGICAEEKAVCEELAKNPFESSLGGALEAAAMTMHLEVSFSKDVFIDD